MDPRYEMPHGGIPRHDHLVYLLPRYPRPGETPVHKPVHFGDNESLEDRQAVFPFPGEGDPADYVLPIGPLRIRGSGGGGDPPRPEVAEVGRHGGGAYVEGKAE